MRFAIYIPGDGKIDEQKLRDVGLPLLAAGCSGIPTTSGPDGKPGVVFSWPTNDPRSTIAYLPDNQTWIPATVSDDRPANRYWVGFTNNAPPTPGDLAWGQQFSGSEVKLGDGNMWLIPEAGMLTKSCRLNDDGSWGYYVAQKFQAYWDESCQWFQLLTGAMLDGEDRLSVPASCCDYLCRALSINYRLTPEVVSHLSLFNTNTIIPALSVTVSGITINEELLQKKTVDTPPAI